MAKYKVLEKSYIGMRMVEPGEIVDHEFFPDARGVMPSAAQMTNLQLVPEKKGKAAKAVETPAPEGDGSDLT